MYREGNIGGYREQGCKKHREYGRNQRRVMTHYWELLGKRKQLPIRSTKDVHRVTQSCRTRNAHADFSNISRVRPRTFNIITNKSLLYLVRLKTACLSKKSIRSILWERLIVSLVIGINQTNLSTNLHQTNLPTN